MPRPPDKAPVRSDLSFQVEPFGQIASELLPLFERHHRELFDLALSAPLDPDWRRYLVMAAAGKIRVMTARAGDVLAGYIINVIDTHIFSKNFLYACIEKFYLDMAYRGGGFARTWFAANEADLKGLGCKVVLVAEKIANDRTSAGVLFKRMGYRPAETIWLREL